MIPVTFIEQEADTRVSKSSIKKAWVATPTGIKEVRETSALPGFEEDTNSFEPWFYEVSADLLKAGAALAEMAERGELERASMLVVPVTGRIAMFGVEK
jgi:hypothetical protein